MLVILTDATFIGGYRPFDGGDDGLIFSGFARDMLQHLVAGDIAGALKGVETVFYFNPGMRYFRALEFLFFGDTFLLYLLLVLILPLIVHAAVARFIGERLGLRVHARLRADAGRRAVRHQLSALRELGGARLFGHARRDGVPLRSDPARRSARHALRRSRHARVLGRAAA